MVERVSWRSPVDHESRLCFDEHAIRVSPRVLAATIEYDRQYLSKRCRQLAEAGLLASGESGLYQRTERGRSYLEGELDVSGPEN
ncbi:hypothetical protein [Natronococcus occultus]|uniref:hypothetical protein n=1 Tax=Natronococcus occultus TaxID=29288 RepID=UPI000677790B|nr:hypothetical protein [Natronococcus occultus]